MSNTPTKDTDKHATPRFGKGSAFVGKKARSGAPRGNSNAIVRHGLKAGKLPPKCQYIEHQINRLHRELEKCVLAVKQEITLSDAATIQSAIKWERHGALCQRWLRLEAEKLSATERLKFSESIAKASDNRDRSIRSLGLDAPPKAVDLTTYLTTSKEATDDSTT